MKVPAANEVNKNLVWYFGIWFFLYWKSCKCFKITK